MRRGRGKPPPAALSEHFRARCRVRFPKTVQDVQQGEIPADVTQKVRRQGGGSPAVVPGEDGDRWHGSWSCAGALGAGAVPVLG